MAGSPQNPLEMTFDSTQNDSNRGLMVELQEISRDLGTEEA
jgi:hypothetical protein